jgi:hypothetical protein
MNKYFGKLIGPVMLWIGTIHWKQKSPITDDDKNVIKKMIADDYFVILSHRRNHLSTYFISLANFVLTGKFSYWSHSFMNLEDEVKSDDDFRLIEAVGVGTKYSTFEDAFGTVDGVVLLKPKNMTLTEWTAVLDKAKSELGKPYDSLFDLKNDNKLSCVELVRTALMALPDYFVRFAKFEEMIQKRKNLTPQMFYDCEDFEVHYQVRR